MDYVIHTWISLKLVYQSVKNFCQVEKWLQNNYRVLLIFKN